MANRHDQVPIQVYQAKRDSNPLKRIAYRTDGLSTGQGRSSSSITLDQLVALNDEIVALARAGVPLERGLSGLGKDLPGGLGRVADELSKRLEAGESLDRVFADAGQTFPPVYQAVVQAGLRGGRLPSALEELSTSVRRVAELRRLIGVSALYPLFVLGVAYAVFVFLSITWVPTFTKVADEMGLELFLYRDLYVLTSGIARWTNPWLPLVVIVPLIVLWYRSGRSTWLARVPFLRRLPTLGRLLYAGRMATFSEVLALLVKQSVPLDEAVTLAADASGDAGLRRAGEQIAEQIRRGDRPETQQLPQEIPPLFGWLLLTARHHPDLSKLLRQKADAYRHQARRLSDLLTMYLPIFLSAGIGGLAVLIIAIGTLGPWYYLLHQLGR